MQGAVGCRRYGEDGVAAEVHDKEVGADEAKAVGAGRQDVTAELDGDFADEVVLVALLDAGGVAAGVDLDGEEDCAVLEANAARVTVLYGAALAAEEDGSWNELLQFCGREQSGRLVRGGD